MRSHKLGKEGEDFAQEFLLNRGYRILATNYRTQVGELDIAAKEGEIFCFIEVKTRQDETWDAFEAVDRRKQSKIRRVAQEFLMEFFGTVDLPGRFDVLALHPREAGGFDAELLKDAFGI